MRSFVVFFLCACFLLCWGWLCAPSAAAAAPMTMVGTWKVKSITGNGKELPKDKGFAMWKVGAYWKFKKDGSLTAASFEGRWTYDAESGELVAQSRNVFGYGWWRDTFTASVKQINRDAELRFTMLFIDFEMVLTPD